MFVVFIDSVVVGCFFDLLGSLFSLVVQILLDDVFVGLFDVEVGYEDDVGFVYEQDFEGVGMIEVVFVDFGGDFMLDCIVEVSCLDSNLLLLSFEFIDDGDVVVVFFELQDLEDVVVGEKCFVVVKV